MRYDVDAIRADFPIFETGIVYLDSANTSQRPRQVLEAMDEYYTKFNSNIHRGAYRFSEIATEHYESTRAKAKRFLNARSTREKCSAIGQPRVGKSHYRQQTRRRQFALAQ